MTPLDRAAVRAGRLSLSYVHNGRYRRHLDDAYVEKVIAKLGVERVWRIIDKLTTPVVMIAAE
jgi:hypothetical protein